LRAQRRPARTHRAAAYGQTENTRSTRRRRAPT
jgi:hypothetical protein